MSRRLLALLLPLAACPPHDEAWDRAEPRLLPGVVDRALWPDAPRRDGLALPGRPCAVLIDPGVAGRKLRCDLIDDDAGRPALDQCSDELSRPRSITFYGHDDALPGDGLVAISTVPHGALGPSHSWRAIVDGGRVVREVSESPAGTATRRWLAHEPGTGRPLRGEQRTGGGAPAAIARSHDAHGRLTYAELDEDGDGEPEITQHVAYLEAQRRVVHSIVDHGVLTQRFLDHDAELRLVTTTTEIDGDPAPGREVRTYLSCAPQEKP